MQRIAVLINRRATRLRRDPALAERLAASAGHDAAVIDTDDVAELSAAARQIAHFAPRVVALCGGDGTYMHALTALRETYAGEELPAFAFVPAGSVSTIARNFGARDALETLSTLVCFAREGRIEDALVAHRTIDANGKVGTIFGAALVANFFDVYYGTAGDSYLDAARIVARIFVESFVGGPYARRVLEPIPCTIEVDAVPLGHQRYSLICCATIRDLGLHMHVNYRCSERDDALHLVASALPTRRLGPQMFRVLTGRRIKGDAHFDGLVRDFNVRFGTRGTWVLDGDLFEDERVRVRPGPTVELFAPRARGWGRAYPRR